MNTTHPHHTHTYLSITPIPITTPTLSITPIPLTTLTYTYLTPIPITPIPITTLAYTYLSITQYLKYLSRYIGMWYKSKRCKRKYNGIREYGILVWCKIILRVR